MINSNFAYNAHLYVAAVQNIPHIGYAADLRGGN